MLKDDVHQIVSLGMTGRLSRREVIARLAMLGLSTSAIASALAAAGLQLARAAAGRRGENGVLKLLYWQAPVILNPHFSIGTKDDHAARLCVEPLLTANVAGVLSPVLAAEVPSRANGGLSADGKSVTYKLKPGVKWADGQPFTAVDVVFTYQFIINKEAGTTSYANYDPVEKVEALGPTTVKVTFKAPTAAWYVPFLGVYGSILPKHALENYVGANGRNAPFSLKAFGTGPYKVETFRPGDLVIYSINENYRDPSKPAFQQVQIKGGGDAVSAARAVLETGEYDYAWNLQVEWPVLDAMRKAGKGVLITESGDGVEAIFCNLTDPNKEVDGQRSSLKAAHPFLSDPKVRQAFGLALDRGTIAKQLYGNVEGEATANTLTTPTLYNSKNTKMVFDVAKANQLLDEAGWQRGPDGIRQKGGVKMQVTYATSVNTLRQKEQEIVKAGWTRIGVGVTLKSVDAGVFFGNLPGNNDTLAHFYTDVQMFTGTFALYPRQYMNRYYSGDPAKDVAQKENNWSGRNVVRWVNKEFNQMFDQAQVELDPQKNAALWVKMNDLVVTQGVSLPLIDRRAIAARAKNLEVGANLSPFDAHTWNIADWRRTG